MGNKTPKKTQKPKEEEPVIEKVVSPKRVAIASVVCIIVTGMIIWSLSHAAQRLADSAFPDEPPQKSHSTQVRLPQKGDAANVMKGAKKSITEFSLDDYTATGSAARSVIDRLQELQKSEFGIEDYFCKMFCN